MSKEIKSIETETPTAVRCSAVLAGGDTVCACCGSLSEREYSIHRNGFCDGPDVWLCNDCGAGELPTLCEIWCRIKSRMENGCRIDLAEAS